MRKFVTLMLFLAVFVAAAHAARAGAATANPYPSGWSNPSVTKVHCRRTYHCSWTEKDHRKVRRCHVCP